MKDSTRNIDDMDATREGTPMQNEKLRRNQKRREQGKGPRAIRNVPGVNERNNEDEMENLYREEENRGTVEAA